MTTKKPLHDNSRIHFGKKGGRKAKPTKPGEARYQHGLSAFTDHELQILYMALATYEPHYHDPNPIPKEKAAAAILGKVQMELMSRSLGLPREHLRSPPTPKEGLLPTIKKGDPDA